MELLQLQASSPVKIFLFSIALFFGLLTFSVTSISGEGQGVKKLRPLKIGQKIVMVRVAKTVNEQKKGLMHITHLPQNEGMLFIYPKEMKLTFWMKNTHIPLSIGFFNAKKKLVKILEMPAQISSLQKKFPRFSSEDSQYALEMNKGWFSKNKIKLGDSFELIPVKK